MAELREPGVERGWCYPEDGPPIDSERRATDLIGDTAYNRATLIAAPVGRLSPDFGWISAIVGGLAAESPRGHPASRACGHKARLRGLAMQDFYPKSVSA